MAAHKLSENEIKIRIVPKRARWPERGTTAAWTRAHDCVDSLQDLVRSLDVACLEAEQSREPTAGGIARRRAEICEEAMRNLASFRPFHIAEKAVTENIVSLERLNDRDHEQVQMHEKLGQALRDLREGVEATGRMLQERCKVRESSTVRENAYVGLSRSR